MAAEYDDTIDAGATYSVYFDYRNEDGSPVNLTGYTAACQFREDPRDTGAPSLTVTPAIDGPLGRVTLTLSAAQTGSLLAPRYVYAIELTAPGGEPIQRLVEGEMTISPEVVR